MHNIFMVAEKEKRDVKKDGKKAVQTTHKEAKELFEGKTIKFYFQAFLTFFLFSFKTTRKIFCCFCSREIKKKAERVKKQESQWRRLLQVCQTQSVFLKFYVWEGFSVRTANEGKERFMKKFSRELFVFIILKIYWHGLWKLVIGP